MGILKKASLSVLGILMTTTIAAADTAKINGTEIFYEKIGSGPPLLLMHGGLGLDHTYFRPFMDSLSEHYTLIYYDHHGNGRSEKPADFADLTFDKLTKDASELIKHLGYDKVHVFGHSYGGFIAQEFALKYSDQINKLILANTVPVLNYAPEFNGTETQMAALGKLFSAPATDDKDFADTWNIVSQMYYKDYDPKIGEELDKNTKYSYQAWNQASVLLGSFNTEAKLGEISVPTLAMGGKYDGITPTAHGAQKFADQIKGAKLVNFENSAHFPMIEQTKEFNEAIHTYLSSD